MDARPWVLVVGGSHAEIPLIDAAHRRGLLVATTGNRPHDLGHAHADRYVEADFSDREAIRRAAAELGAIGIVSGCNDFAAISTAWAAEQLGLPGHDSYELTLRIHHKDRFRELLAELDLHSPRSGVVSDVSQALGVCETVGYPVIVKPVDLTGGKGMTVCHDPSTVEDAVRRALAASRQPHLVIERFLSGSRHGYTCFVEQGRVTFWFADDEQYASNQFLVSGTTTPTAMPPEALDELARAVEQIVDALSLVDGLMHVQCILTDEGPRIIELCRRCPGDLYPWFVTHATGFDYAGAVLDAELGRPLPVVEGDGAVRPIGRHCLMTDREGELRSITYDDTVSSRIVDRLEWWEPGRPVTNHLLDKFGIIFMEFADEAEMRVVTSELSSRIEIEIDEERHG